MTEYIDFLIRAVRSTTRTVAVHVEASPAGAMDGPVTVTFSATESDRLRDSFRGGNAGAGRARITQAEATGIGKRLAEVLFPPAVFQLLAQSITTVLQKPHRGLRIRLALDASLVDLPWEYVYRPDRLDHEGVSGFLLLDPAISMVRGEADARIVVRPITGRQQLAFVGALWDRQRDLWGVAVEFEALRDALQPVSHYIEPAFTVAMADDAFQQASALIFHYAGHCDFDAQDGRPFLVREARSGDGWAGVPIAHLDELAASLGQSDTRLVVMSACNSGFWPAVEPLVNAGIPAIIAVNGIVASTSTIEFCTKLYESLAVGLSLDEAVDRARMHVLEWGQRESGLFDWGLFMVYMPSPESVLFPRERTSEVETSQQEVRRAHEQTIQSTLALARDLDGMNFGEIMSVLSAHRVLILGRFTGPRLEVLEAIKQHLAQHPNRYKPELFTFARPDSRDLIESITGFASLSRFVVVDLSEPRSVPAELEAIVKNFLSVPFVAIISGNENEYATYSSIERRQNVVKPPVRYRDLNDLLERIDEEVVAKAEAKLVEVRPTAN